MPPKNDMPWREAIIKVLSEAGTALHYNEIAEQVGKMGLRKSLGATPANTVSTYLNSSLHQDGKKSPFIKTEPGRFMLKDALGSVAKEDVAEALEVAEEGVPVVKSAGIFWNAARVDWKNKPKLLGQQATASVAVDFSEQIGIYILYDGSRVIYVGRAVERPLEVRLSEHMKDRLNGRWDRFSWFGLKGVDDKGGLTGPEFTADQKQIISLMEAILIEALEPPLNRKRGDDFSDKEYLQIHDPALEAKQKKAIIEELTAKLGS